MKNSSLLVIAMAERCSVLIRQSQNVDSGLPEALQRNHLLWMCDRIEQNADEWPVTTLHRWIGFIQCGVLANRMTDLPGVKSLFDDVKNAYGRGNDDEDLLDHLNPENAFEIDIGGQG